MTESGSVEIQNTTNLSILLGGASPGHTYMITVNAVNVVGGGVSTGGTCAVSVTGLAIQYAWTVTMLLVLFCSSVATRTSSRIFFMSNDLFVRSSTITSKGK